MKEKGISYGDLVILENKFHIRTHTIGVNFPSEEIEQECLLDYKLQYQNGNSNPRLRFLWNEDDSILQHYQEEYKRLFPRDFDEVQSLENTICIGISDDMLRNEVVKLNNGEVFDLFLTRNILEQLCPNWRNLCEPKDVFGTMDYNWLCRYHYIVINATITLHILNHHITIETGEDESPMIYKSDDDWGETPCMVTFETELTSFQPVIPV